MLKTMSVALLAASILAAPAFAAGPAKTDASAKSTQTTGTSTGKTEINKTDASKTDAKAGTAQTGDKTNEMKSTVGKAKGKPHASLLRHTHRHTAHLRHHDKVKVQHASAAAHKKVSLKRVTPATRRG
ncbi:conserved protein of unknown function [Bradyrhizobium sp. ORS 285]|uniref:hypothetical protein n=1 Tax=Bradyrhizobium sp. ORS 285 TaxID=115808 RepID=UPI0002409AAC|nr:hypothetical protein [Bradyrhizobium sp. ORS 285]CCD87573.1 conserved hypothetical protein [Bradyrhizobium sp. ORS 285]SMX57800.1 conserved protein of unknown function [Bradyrhizobium sp. ORS 285]